MDPAYRRHPVYYRTTEAPGTIIIDTSERFLYLVQPNNLAIRYGIGVGRDGFQWQGLLRITRKAEWPDWTPLPEMIAPPALSAAPAVDILLKNSLRSTRAQRLHLRRQSARCCRNPRTPCANTAPALQIWIAGERPLRHAQYIRVMPPSSG
jgi:hypothetical protein